MKTARERVLNDKDPEVLRFYIEQLFIEKDRQDRVISDQARRLSEAAQVKLSLEEQFIALRKKHFAKALRKEKVLNQGFEA